MARLPPSRSPSAAATMLLDLVVWNDGPVNGDSNVDASGNLANGTLSVTDTDAGQAGFRAGTTHGTYGDGSEHRWRGLIPRRERQPGHSSARQWRHAD